MDLHSAIIGIVLILISVLPFILIGKKNTKKRKNRLEIITNSAASLNGKINLSDLWMENAIGIDKFNKIVYFSKKSQEPNSYKVIILKEVQNCSILRTENSSKTITKLALLLEYSDKNKSNEELSFYEKSQTLNLVNELELVHKWSNIIKNEL